jgi:hypothetical protein
VPGYREALDALADRSYIVLEAGAPAISGTGEVINLSDRGLSVGIKPWEFVLLGAGAASSVVGDSVSTLLGCRTNEVKLEYDPARARIQIRAQTNGQRPILSAKGQLALYCDANSQETLEAFRTLCLCEWQFPGGGHATVSRGWPELPRNDYAPLFSTDPLSELTHGFSERFLCVQCDSAEFESETIVEVVVGPLIGQLICQRLADRIHVNHFLAWNLVRLSDEKPQAAGTYPFEINPSNYARSVIHAPIVIYARSEENPLRTYLDASVFPKLDPTRLIVVETRGDSFAIYACNDSGRGFERPLEETLFTEYLVGNVWSEDDVIIDALSRTARDGRPVVFKVRAIGPERVRQTGRESRALVTRKDLSRGVLGECPAELIACLRKGETESLRIHSELRRSESGPWAWYIVVQLRLKRRTIDLNELQAFVRPLTQRVKARCVAGTSLTIELVPFDEVPVSARERRDAW